MSWCATSIPQKSKNLPKKSKNHTQKIQKLFLLPECSGLFAQVRLRTFIAPNVPILSDVQPEPTSLLKNIFYWGSRIACLVLVDLPKKSKNITQKSKNKSKITPKHNHINPKMDQQIQKHCKRNPKNSTPCGLCRFAAAALTYAVPTGPFEDGEEPLEGSP